MSIDRYRMLAGYNAWANGRLYDAAAGLPDEDYRADRKAYFGSLHGTLNHVLVADRVWMARLTRTGSAPDRLDAILHDDLAALREARDLEDARITAYVEGLDPAILEHPFEYRNMAGTLLAQPLSSALDHFFNHQTHHRGQAHALVSMAGAEAPSLDLVYYEREIGVCREV
jgi:uncharacterized damage-inducible protein DinB